MKKLYTLLLLAFAFSMNAQTTLSQWNFDNLDPATSMIPTTGAGTFTIIGGVVDNLTSGLMPAGNPSTGKAYSIKTFPAPMTASGTAGYQFAVSTSGITEVINVQFDPRGSGTASKWQQYEYSINGTTWNVLSNNAGALTNSFTATPMVSLTFPTTCSNNANFKFRIVSIFDPAGTDYASVTGGATAYSAGGTWRLDNVTFSSGVLKVAQNSISGLKVYPNPVKNGTLYIDTDANSEKTVAVYDILGKQVIKTVTSSSTINVSTLTSGVYIVKITEEGKTATRKLVIQ